MCVQQSRRRRGETGAGQTDIVSPVAALPLLYTTLLHSPCYTLAIHRTSTLLYSLRCTQYRTILYSCYTPLLYYTPLAVQYTPFAIHVYTTLLYSTLAVQHTPLALHLMETYKLPRWSRYTHRYLIQPNTECASTSSRQAIQSYCFEVLTEC